MKEKQPSQEPSSHYGGKESSSCGGVLQNAQQAVCFAVVRVFCFVRCSRIDPHFLFRVGVDRCCCLSCSLLSKGQFELQYFVYRIPYFKGRQRIHFQSLGLSHRSVVGPGNFGILSPQGVPEAEVVESSQVLRIPEAEMVKSSPVRREYLKLK